MSAKTARPKHEVLPDLQLIRNYEVLATEHEKKGS
jgi:hypothetical protein